MGYSSSNDLHNQYTLLVEHTDLQWYACPFLTYTIWMSTVRSIIVTKTWTYQVHEISHVHFVYERQHVSLCDITFMKNSIINYFNSLVLAGHAMRFKAHRIFSARICITNKNLSFLLSLYHPVYLPTHHVSRICQQSAQIIGKSKIGKQGMHAVWLEHRANSVIDTGIHNGSRMNINRIGDILWIKIISCILFVLPSRKLNSSQCT